MLQRLHSQLCMYRKLLACMAKLHAWQFLHDEHAQIQAACWQRYVLVAMINPKFVAQQQHQLP